MNKKSYRGHYLREFWEVKTKNIFQENGNPLVVKVGDLIEKKATIEEIVHAAKIALEQKRFDNEREETEGGGK